MNIRNKIQLYVSSSVTLLAGAVLFFIYQLFANYREEEFQQRQKERITNTLRFITEIEKADSELIETLDQLTIHKLYDEKLLIFNKNKELIYTSIDDTPIPYPEKILQQLSANQTWVEQKDGKYDVIGIYIEKDNKAYYGISKAYDRFGYSKLNYLRNVLIAAFFVIVTVLLATTYWIARSITRPLTAITRQIAGYSIGQTTPEQSLATTKDEIAILANKFALLVKRTNEAFLFQKHFIHHLSHELKTPISILVSNFERMERATSLKALHSMLQEQKENTKGLSEIIDALLAISKSETGGLPAVEPLRIDELLFDVAEEVKAVFSEFIMAVHYAPNSEANLTIRGSKRLLGIVFRNLLHNAAQYSPEQKVGVELSADSGYLSIAFQNRGAGITPDEQPFLFQHFFRGANSQGKRGLGLGLVLAHKIVSLHGGIICYQIDEAGTNVFTVSLPLS
ncbi:MAG: HAMP domain-containing sensor histidine kinase [Cytophagales bacterium]|nr:HAMP domain-containing histidine kinase [Bernardetiaceae bacterium]MDW8204080.1 HAMP domain-containing sensor histidine kinase [Cytophagales bacterium]